MRLLFEKQAATLSPVSILLPAEKKLVKDPLRETIQFCFLETIWLIKVESQSKKNSLLRCLPLPFQAASEECGSLRAQLEEQSRQLQVTKEAVHELKVGLAGVLSRKGDLVCFYWVVARCSSKCSHWF